MKISATLLATAMLLAFQVFIFPQSSLATPTPQTAENKGNSSPIEMELNRAIKKSFNHIRKRPSRLTYGSRQTTRITITHQVSAPYPEAKDETKEAILKNLRKSLYSQISNECDILSEMFNKRCNLSTLKISPRNYPASSMNMITLNATATYLLTDAK